MSRCLFGGGLQHGVSWGVAVLGWVGLCPCRGRHQSGEELAVFGGAREDI